MIRPAGGRLAAYHEGALVLDLVARHPQARDELPASGSPCSARSSRRGLRRSASPRVSGRARRVLPGEFSVNAAGTTKLVGTAQRLTRHGLPVQRGGAGDRPRAGREVLVDAYAALGLDWRPASVGAVSDHVPG